MSKQVYLSMTPLKIMIACVVVAMLAGCTYSVSEGDLYGTYTLEFPFAHETLVLYENGQYEQTIVVNDPVDTARAVGRWEYSAEYDNILLYHGLVVTDVSCELNSTYNQPTEGYVLRSIIKYFPWDNIELTTACEDAFYAKQQE